MVDFPWVPLYTELGRRLLDYEHRQDELLAILTDLRERKLPVITLVDQDSEGRRLPLSELDPFSFFASFNRRATTENRQEILREIRDKLGLQSPVPSRFNGIPIVSPFSSWFIDYAGDRDPEDVPSLWRLARLAVDKGIAGLDRELFERCLQIQSIALPKLTEPPRVLRRLG